MKYEPAEFYNKIYTILVGICGASDSDLDRESFIYSFTKDICEEYRFCGHLGFGGKYWKRGYVTCYREDETKTRKRIIEEANALISKLIEENKGV